MKLSRLVMTLSMTVFFSVGVYAENEFYNGNVSNPGAGQTSAAYDKAGVAIAAAKAAKAAKTAATQANIASENDTNLAATCLNLISKGASASVLATNKCTGFCPNRTDLPSCVSYNNMAAQNKAQANLAQTCAGGACFQTCMNYINTPQGRMNASQSPSCAFNPSMCGGFNTAKDCQNFIVANFCSKQSVYNAYNCPLQANFQKWCSSNAGKNSPLCSNW